MCFYKELIQITSVNQWHTVQSTSSMHQGAGGYGPASAIWEILWPEANSTIEAWLEMM